MIAAQPRPDGHYETWRKKARALLRGGVAPEDACWSDAGDLFSAPLSPRGEEAGGGADLGARGINPIPTSLGAMEGKATVPRAFFEVTEKAALHSDPDRFALLYRVLWRLQDNRALMEDAADPDIVRLSALAKAVRRDEHKMHAFVRFKEVASENGPRFVAWFEPQHHITRASADFFVRRFAGMAWSIITPEASIHWDGGVLTHGPGGKREDVPAVDACDDDWRIYFQSMFNPARLKIAAMKREMPKHYWRNLPEAERIAPMIREARARTEEMVAAMPTLPSKRAGAAVAKIMPEELPARLQPIAGHENPPASFEELNRALAACRACPLWRDATQAVPGEGPIQQPLLALVGEQPGDQEDLAGKPFIGPAGKMLDQALGAAGIERGEIFVTNAVKHFKHEPRGKRRLHKRPDRGEVEICRWWLKHELALVQPKLVVALGVTALQSLSLHKGSLAAVRDATLETREGQFMRATIHPSALLRLPNEADKEAEFARFVADLKKAKALALKAA